MAWTQQQLDALEDAIASGSTRVAYSDKSVEYRSLDEMMRIRDMMRKSLGLSAKKSNTILTGHDRGFVPGARETE